MHSTFFSCSSDERFEPRAAYRGVSSTAERVLRTIQLERLMRSGRRSRANNGSRRLIRAPQAERISCPPPTIKACRNCGRLLSLYYSVLSFQYSFFSFIWTLRIMNLLVLLFITIEKYSYFYFLLFLLKYIILLCYYVVAKLLNKIFLSFQFMLLS